MLTLANSPVTSVLLWVGVLMVLVLVGAVAIFAFRRSVLADRGAGADNAGMLEQMRRMVEKGEMTQEEFDQARRAIVQRAKEPRSPGDPDNA